MEPAYTVGLDSISREYDRVQPPVEGSILLVLDAASFSELARATLPAVFPFGFHGQWYPDGGDLHRTMP